MLEIRNIWADSALTLYENIIDTYVVDIARGFIILFYQLQKIFGTLLFK